MIDINDKSNTPIPPPDTYGTLQVQQPQGQSVLTVSEGNGGPSVPRIVLGVVCGLVIANTVRQIITNVVMLKPSGFVDVFDFISFAATRFIDVLFPIVLDVPPIILFVYAIRKKVVSNRVALIMLVAWWTTWIPGLIIYLTKAHEVVPDHLFTQMMIRHALSALGPAMATVCIILIRRGKGLCREDIHYEGVFYRSSPRIVLGAVAAIVLVGGLLGILALVSSCLEKAQLAQTGASGVDYWGPMLTNALGIVLLVPAIPAILLMVFAVRPTRSTRVAAIVGLVLWWIPWVLAGFIMLPIQVGGIEPRETLDIMGVFFALAIPPAASTLCVWLASRNTNRG